MTHPYIIWIICIFTIQGLADSVILVWNSYGISIDYLPNRFATLSNPNIKGYIESANPVDACSNIVPPLLPTAYTMDKIVLVNGTSECSFMTKVRNIKDAGYDTAVLFDPFPGPFEYANITLPIERSTFNLSVVLVLYDDGLLIQNNYVYQNHSSEENFVIVIEDPNNTWFAFACLIFTGICLICICIYCICSVIKCCIKLLCSEEEGENNPIVEALEEPISNDFDDSPSISNEVIRKWITRLNKQFPAKKTDTDYLQDCCPICQEVIASGEEIRELDCRHVYHLLCIDEWLIQGQNMHSCPCCRNVLDLAHSVPTEKTPLLASYSAAQSSNSNDNERRVFYNLTHDFSDLLRTENTQLLASSSGVFSSGDCHSTDILPGVQGSVNNVDSDESEYEFSELFSELFN